MNIPRNGEVLKDYVRSSGLTQGEAARRANIDVAVLSRAMNDKGALTDEQVQTLIGIVEAARTALEARLTAGERATIGD